MSSIQSDYLKSTMNMLNFKTETSLVLAFICYGDLKTAQE